MADIPDNVTLDRLARHLVEFRQETRTRLDGLESGMSGMERNLQRLHDDFGISAPILRQIDDGQDAYREDTRTLFEAVGALRTRLEVVKRELGEKCALPRAGEGSPKGRISGYRPGIQDAAAGIAPSPHLRERAAVTGEASCRRLSPSPSS